MNISCIWVLRTLTILRQKLEAHKQTEFVSIFHRTIGDEFYSVAFRKTLYKSIDELQKDLDEWLVYYNTQAAPIAVNSVLGKHHFSAS